MTLSELERVEIALRRVLFEEQDAPLWVGRLVGPDPIPPVRPFLLFSRLQAWRGFCQERLRLLVGLFSFGPFRLSFGSRLPRICLARCKSTVSKPSVNLV